MRIRLPPLPFFPIARSLRWPGALLFGVVVPVCLRSDIGFLGCEWGLLEQQTELLVLTASALLVVAAPLGASRPHLSAVAAGGHAFAGALACALGVLSTPFALFLLLYGPGAGEVPLWAPPLFVLYAAAPWLTAAAFFWRAWRLWAASASARGRLGLAALALALYAPAFPAGRWAQDEWARVLPTLGSAEGAEWDAAVARARWLVLLPAWQRLNLEREYCEATGAERERFAEAGRVLFEDEYREDECGIFYYD